MLQKLLWHRTLVTALVLCGTGALHGQEVAPAFEVASIKPSKTESQSSATRFLPGGDFVATNATLRDIIMEAYHLVGDRLQGGPKWIDSDRFDIEAKPAAGTKSQIAVVMLQTLLGDRFQLKVHLETRDVSGYGLVVVKGGPKIKMNTEETCLPPCGGTSVSPSGKLTSRKVPMPRFASRLAEIVGRPVADETGLTGQFDIDLEWAPEAGQFGGKGRELDNDSRPSLYTALETIGLKLEPRKTSVEIMVIDHVERPSEN